MKRRESIAILLAGLAVAGCGREKAAVAENPWIEMRDDWEGMSGGQIDVGEPLRIGWGEGLTAVKWQGQVPTPPFELELMAKRVDGTDFFCAVTFPVREGGECVTLVVEAGEGAWSAFPRSMARMRPRTKRLPTINLRRMCGTGSGW